MSKNGETGDFPSKFNVYPIDLLKNFGASGDSPPSSAIGDVELGLGLSLNGRFGTEPRNKKIARSNSVSTFNILSLEQNEFETAKNESSVLKRTCSLPVETAEEVMRKKKMQSLKRLEAKRKRCEKIAAKSNDDGSNTKNGCMIKKENSGQFVCNDEIRWKRSSQGSTGSQGSSASAVSDMENKSVQEDKSSAQVNTKKETENSSPNKKHCTLARSRSNGVREMDKNFMEEMPCVSTRGEGPNGRRIEGFLYQYRKGEEVRIVCVCHGSFLTPAEFVKHAGGGDVAHPLRHIVVSTAPSALL